jgi:hypothetical protein
MLLIAETCVSARATQHIGADTGTKDGQLREAASTERHFLNEFGVEGVANGGVGLVQQGRAGNGDGVGHVAGLQSRINGGGCADAHKNLCEFFGFETILCDGYGIGAHREIRDAVGAVLLCGRSLFEIGTDVARLNFCVWNHGTAAIGDGAIDGTKILLRQNRDRDQ